jgi:hypothetical protein
LAACAADTSVCGDFRWVIKASLCLAKRSLKQKNARSRETIPAKAKRFIFLPYDKSVSPVKTQQFPPQTLFGADQSF